MTDKPQPPPYPLPGTHVEPRDGDMEEAQRQIVKFAEPMFAFYDECVRIRDQHRAQIEAMAQAVDGTRIRELEAKLYALRVAAAGAIVALRHNKLDTTADRLQEAIDASVAR